MKVHKNAEKLCEWLRAHQPATVKEITESGLLKTREASDAAWYAVRHGAVIRIEPTAAQSKYYVRFILAGNALPVLKTKGLAARAPSFDALLSAWGIAQSPPKLRSRQTHKQMG